MAIIKCKMCGGDIELTADKTFGTCEFCGSTMTLPKIDDDQRAAAFNRGNHFRRIGEFDKALAVYERIVREDDTDAEAHWCCALCRFGIEYVEDPATYEYLPTCHRASFDSFLEDVDYLAAVEHSEGITKRQYQKDAATIAEVQRGILATSQNAEPYDVFICYKESDENGQRTRDSLMAQDIYYQLTEQGRKVFFARITLEDVVGTQYEPYIFAALNSAKVMIVVGTKPEYLNAVWVKNEWSRFLAMMKKDRHKLLLPCYRDMDPYDMPEALSVLQSYDMSKIGFIQDLTRGIAKVLDADKKPEPVKETVVMQQAAAGANTAPLLKRAFMFLEDGEWASADEYCEKVLDMDPECAEAYLGKLMAELHIKKQEDLQNQAEPFDGKNNYQKVVRYADDILKVSLAGYISFINTRNENARLEGVYQQAKRDMQTGKTEEEFKKNAEVFESIRNYKDSANLVPVCYEKAEVARKDKILADACAKMTGKNICNYESAIMQLKQIPGWKDADNNVEECHQIIERIKHEEKARLELSAKEKEARKKKCIKLGVVATLIIAVVFLFVTTILPAIRYNQAMKLLNADHMEQAAIAFGKAGNYKDAQSRSLALWHEFVNYQTISAGWKHFAAIKNDGTVVVSGSNSNGEGDVGEWTDIISVACGYAHTVGLKSDGTVVATGSNKEGQCNVNSWKNIVSIACGTDYTVGLKSDGTVVAVGDNYYGETKVGSWNNIIAISAMDKHTLGLKLDGTVVANGKNYDGEINVYGLSNVIAVSAGWQNSAFLHSDGRVTAIGRSRDGATKTESWNGIIAVCSCYHTVGLKADGTVVAVGDNDDGECNITQWRNIVAICTEAGKTIGLKSDGSLVAVGEGVEEITIDPEKWSDIRVP